MTYIDYKLLICIKNEELVLKKTRAAFCCCCSSDHDLDDLRYLILVEVAFKDLSEVFASVITDAVQLQVNFLELSGLRLDVFVL